MFYHSYDEFLCFCVTSPLAICPQDTISRYEVRLPVLLNFTPLLKRTLDKDLQDQSAPASATPVRLSDASLMQHASK